MKSLMLHVAPDADMEARLQVALDITRRFESHLTLIQPALTQDFVSFDMAGGAHFVAQAYAAAEQRRAEVKEHIEADLANEGINWDWQAIDAASILSILIEGARLSDLAIMSLDGDRRGSSQPSRSLVGDVAISGRTPVLAVPPGHAGMNFGTAMIAYDGGPEASFALRSATPLLAAFDKVVLAEIDGDSEDLPMTDAAEYLARHGVTAVIESSSSKGKTIEEKLVQAANVSGADLLVMGAYGHSRWREALFGGVTHYVLAETKVPVLLAH